jgi:hypothetical protein
MFFEVMREECVMWTVMYIAPTMAMAEKIRERMADEGYEIRLRPMFAGKQPQYEISVRETEVHEVQQLLIEILNEL